MTDVDTDGVGDDDSGGTIIDVDSSGVTDDSDVDSNGAADDSDVDAGGAADDSDVDSGSAADADGYCRRCGAPLRQGAIARTQRACCLNATPIAGVCPTHGPLGPHHVVDSPAVADTTVRPDDGG